MTFKHVMEDLGLPERPKHIRFRDSKLTYALRSSLRFASKARAIKTEAKKNRRAVDDKASLLVWLLREIDQENHKLDERGNPSDHGAGGWDKTSDDDDDAARRRRREEQESRRRLDELESFCLDS